RRVLAGLSVFYPALGSRDYDLCDKLGILPKTFSCMRSSALPLSHTTTRLETITLLRLGRILNFIKYLLDKREMIPEPMPPPATVENTDDRIETGKLLLQRFLYDGKIRGVTSNGDVFEHHIAMDLTENFLVRLKTIRIRGCA
ncbi:MAG: radical SAM protein, partial [Desulfobacterales bacterium]